MHLVVLLHKVLGLDETATARTFGASKRGLVPFRSRSHQPNPLTRPLISSLHCRSSDVLEPVDACGGAKTLGESASYRPEGILSKLLKGKALRSLLHLASWTQNMGRPKMFPVQSLP